MSNHTLFDKIIGAVACAWVAIAASTTTAAPPDPAESFFAASGFTASTPGVRDRTLIAGALSEESALAVVRLNPDRTPDLSFNGTGLVRIRIWGYHEGAQTVMVQPDGKIVVGGNASNPADTMIRWCATNDCFYHPVLVRLNPDGSLDRSFNGDGKVVLDIQWSPSADMWEVPLLWMYLQVDGKLVIGSLEGLWGVPEAPLARINPDGTLDRSFVVPGKTVQETAKGRYEPGAIDASLTGSWYDPAQSGHGFSLQILPGSPQQLLAYWFTFAPQGGQSWIAALGPIEGNRAVVQGVQTVGAGARFPPNFDAANARQEPWGTLTFTFGDCNHGHVDWNSTSPGYGSGGIDLRRLTLPAGLVC